MIQVNLMSNNALTSKLCDTVIKDFNVRNRTIYPFVCLYYDPAEIRITVYVVTNHYSAMTNKYLLN